jgi:hypothetical protein
VASGASGFAEEQRFARRNCGSIPRLLLTSEYDSSHVENSNCGDQ